MSWNDHYIQEIYIYSSVQNYSDDARIHITYSVCLLMNFINLCTVLPESVSLYDEVNCTLDTA